MPDPIFTPQPHTEAAAILRGKPVVARSVLDELRGRVFTVGGVEAANVLQRVQDSIAATAEGETWDDAKANIVSELDPYLGDGADRRAELLLRTHGFQAFQASNWRVAQADDDTTHLQYLTMEDDRVRPGHAALEGVILPKDDPFWQTHFPPWEWGCRCRTRPMNPDLVDEAKQADETRAPDDKLVMEGPALRKLNEGVIVRNGQATSVLPPDGENAFHWHPDNLRLSLDELKARYDEPTWNTFEQLAKNNAVTDGVSLWDWLHGEVDQPPALVAFKDRTEAQAWADANLHPDHLGLTPAERQSLAEYQTSSTWLNRSLQMKQLSDEQARQTVHLDMAFDKAKLKAPLVVWHGSGSGDWLQFKAGDTAELHSFLSTTLAENFDLFKDKVWMKITVPKGSPAIYMDNLSGQFNKEVEMLLPRLGSLKIISIAEREGVHYIEAELIS